MKLNPKALLTRLVVVTSVMILLSIILFITVDWRLGVAIFIGGAAAGAVGMIKYLSLKKKPEIGLKQNYTLLFIGGFAMVIIGLHLIMLGDNGMPELGLGLFFIGYAKLGTEGTIPKWKTIPMGIKILTIFFSISFLLSTFRVPRNATLFFGIQIHTPYAVAINVVMATLPIFIVFLLLGRRGQKFILAILGFSLLNYLIGVLRIMTMPYEEILLLAGRTIPQIPAESVQDALMSMRAMTFITSSIGIIIGLVSLTYIYRKKDYFK